MAALTLTDAEIAVGALRLTTRSNRLTSTPAAAQLDATTFGSGGWREMIGGLKTHTLEVGGLYDASPVDTGALAFDSDLFANLGGSQVPVTIAPNQAAGSVAYVGGVREGALSLFGPVGDIAPFTARYVGDGVLGRGALLASAASTVTATGTGSAVQLGATASGQSLLAAIHITAITGTTPAVTVTIQRDDNSSFTSATTVASIGPVSTVAAATASLTVTAGPITDDYYRAVWTITGTNPVVRFLASIALS